MRIYLILLLFIFFTSLTNSACKRSKTNRSDKNKSKNTATRTEPKAKEKKGRSSSTEQADKVIKTARSYTGTPYKYGGTSRAGLDCSGLSSISFKSVGVTLPRTSQEQSSVGQAVKLKDIQPGDLVFLSDSKASKKITHVGIITEVKGNSARFIHASTKLGVVENELLSGYYHPLIVKVRRVL